MPKTLRFKTYLKILSTLALISLASCSGTASQCQQFAEVTTQSQPIKTTFEQDIKSAQINISKAQNLDAVHAAAQEYHSAVTKADQSLGAMEQSLAGLSITDEQLDEYRDSYVAILSENQAALTNAAKAMDLVIQAKTDEDFKKIFDQFQIQTNQAFGAIQSLDARESDVIEQINRYCSAAAS